MRLTRNDIIHYQSQPPHFNCTCNPKRRHRGFTPIVQGRYRYYRCSRCRLLHRQEIQTPAGLVPVPLAYRGFIHQPVVGPPFSEVEIAHRPIAIPVQQTRSAHAFFNWEERCHCRQQQASRTHYWVPYDDTQYNRCWNCGGYIRRIIDRGDWHH